jgi:hypothetical protein
MSFGQALHYLPQWVQVWAYWMFIAIAFAPLVLFIWRRLWRLAAIIQLSNIAASITVLTMYHYMGYVKLFGLAHLVFWGPLGWYLWGQLQRRSDLPGLGRILIWACFATLMVSLAFDAVDTVRYVLGERTPLVPPPAQSAN